jgi:hypothetical protein
MPRAADLASLTQARRVGWLHEPKLDRWRLQAVKRGKNVALYSRNEREESAIDFSAKLVQSWPPRMGTTCPCRWAEILPITLSTVSAVNGLAIMCLF